jgi:hypothetical protein
VNARCPARPPPFTACGVLVDPVDRAVEAVPLVVRIHSYGFEQPRPLARLGPAVEAVENGLPRSEMVGQIPPRYARAPPPQHRLDEVAVILSRPTRSALRSQNRGDLRPSSVVELKSNHLAAPGSKPMPAWKSFPRRFRARARARARVRGPPDSRTHPSRPRCAGP